MRYRSYSGQPFCEVALANGDHVLITVDAGGVTIKREARRQSAGEILFIGPVHVVTDICLALLDGRPVSDTTVLNVFLSVVSQFRSAEDIRSAFAEATAGP
ncbi:MAG TPA: hypothetical protein VKB68_15255 [Stellaceae bacterium]|nr:hypothetical protein [Stellaceae bacterium]